MAANPRHRRVAFGAGLTAAAMLGLAYAAVPLYQLFCQVTGIGGTTQRAAAAPSQVVDRWVTVRFNADIAPDLAWEFRAPAESVRLRFGEAGVASYTVRNLSGDAVVGTAVYNVTPLKIGAYFNKLECFCFTEQVLNPGESAELPVSFFVDPELLNNRNVREVDVITLSYTFYRAKNQDAAKSVVTSGLPAPPTTN
jgi:cytochrome c oxidase assembly protein subunit 11